MQAVCHNWRPMITNEFVEKACSEVSDYSDDRMMNEFDLFFEQQPAICDFVVELTNESSPQIQELSLFLSYMVFKAVKIGSPETTEVTADRIENAYRESEVWIDRISQIQDGNVPSEISNDLKDDTEPHLIQYVISELNQPLEDGTILDDEQKGEVFFVLKT